MAYCEKHKVEFNELCWCPMCLIDEMEDENEKSYSEADLAYDAETAAKFLEP